MDKKVKLLNVSTNDLEKITQRINEIKNNLHTIMVHNDLHLGNIMVNFKDGRVKLIDFDSSEPIKNKKQQIKKQIKLKKDAEDLDMAIVVINKYFQDLNVEAVKD